MRKPQLHGGNISNIPGDDMRSAAGQCELDEMIVGFVSQVGPPTKVDPGPFTVRDEDIEKLGSLGSGQSRSPEQGWPRQNIFILRKQRCSHEWNICALQTPRDNGRRRANAEAGADKDIGIDDDSHFRAVAILPPFGK